MTATWLGPNRRALAWGMALPAGLAVLGMLLIVGAEARLGRVAGWAGWTLFAIGAVAIAGLIWQWWRPRVGYRAGEVWFYLGPRGPARVPLSVVECFLLGQGPSRLPGRQLSQAQATTVVVRLSEKATDWAQRDVNPALGSWCDGYITIRGTWCEPLNVGVVKRLNRLLHQARKTVES